MTSQPPTVEEFMERWSDEATAAEMDGRGDEWFAGKVDEVMGAGTEPSAATDQADTYE